MKNNKGAAITDPIKIPHGRISSLYNQHYGVVSSTYIRQCLVLSTLLIAEQTPSNRVNNFISIFIFINY